MRGTNKGAKQKGEREREADEREEAGAVDRGAEQGRQLEQFAR